MYQVAREFLARGIPFHTFNVSCTPTHVQLDTIAVADFRLSGYRFSLNDYTSYLQRCAAFLSSPRGRAALLMGGIVGHLAHEHVSLDGVLQGPSSAVTNQRIGVKYVNRSGLEFCDDVLTEDEMDIICGVYRCYTGKSYFGNCNCSYC
ncbi:hypothetical protein BDQ17DRAFT_1237808 [Cyathus striatus]|nr:hypothetical protein BDQ17DRAFT_1237808 [Cyathus striatus]